MTEYDHQKYVFQWAAQPSIRGRYPELEFLFHIKNETKGGAQQVAKDKASGVKKGVPDLFLPVPVGKYHGLWIEMKKEDGRASREQLWWLEHLKANGYACAVCYGWQQATEVLEWYLNLNQQA